MSPPRRIGYRRGRFEDRVDGAANDLQHDGAFLPAAVVAAIIEKRMAFQSPVEIGLAPGCEALDLTDQPAHRIEFQPGHPHRDRCIKGLCIIVLQGRFDDLGELYTVGVDLRRPAEVNCPTVAGAGYSPAELVGAAEAGPARASQRSIRNIPICRTLR